MKKIYLSILAFTCAFSLKAQSEFHMQPGSSVTIQNNGLLFVKGELKAEGNNANLTNSGKIEINTDNIGNGAFTWNSEGTYTGNGEVLFYGREGDGYIRGIGSNLTINKLSIDVEDVLVGPNVNVASVLVERDVNVAELNFERGRFVVDEVYDRVLHVTNTDVNAITGHGAANSNYVQGNLRRSVVADRTYDFPVGTDPRLNVGNGYNLAQIKLPDATLPGNSITAKFVDEDNIGTVNYLAGGFNCTSVDGAPNQQILIDKTWESFGYWSFEPDANSEAWNYDARFYPNLAAVSFSGISDGDMVKMMKAENKYDANNLNNNGLIGSGYNWTATDVQHGSICDGANLDLSNSPNAPFKYLGGTHLGNQNYLAMTGLTGFSGFGGGGSGSVGLPVELLSLKADAIDNKFIRVSWTTATEINNAGFEVLKSEDGINFDNIGWVDGAGNSSSIINYKFDDNDVVANKVYYYRLRQIDYDGQSDLTNIVSAMITDNAVFVISEFMPNPTENTSSFTVVTSETRDINLTVYNTLGQIINDSRLVAEANKTNRFEVNLSEMAAGTYYAIITTGPHTFNKKIVVSR